MHLKTLASGEASASLLGLERASGLDLTAARFFEAFVVFGGLQITLELLLGTDRLSESF